MINLITRYFRRGSGRSSGQGGSGGGSGQGGSGGGSGQGGSGGGHGGSGSGGGGITGGKITVNVEFSPPSEAITLSGIKIQLYKDDQLIGVKETSDEGVVEFTDLISGSLIVKSQEIDGYVAVASRDEVVVNQKNPNPVIVITYYKAGTEPIEEEEPDQEIYISDELGRVVTEAKFETREEVYVSGGYSISEGGVNDVPIENGLYYVKVETPDGEILNKDDKIPNFQVTGGKFTISLFELTEFDFTTKYNKNYWVRMSMKKDFPSGETLSANFSVGSVVPVGKVRIITTMVGGDRSSEGIAFILNRNDETDESVQPTYEDFLDPTSDTGYIHEVKAIGKTDENGEILWEDLKLGDYLLFQEPLDGYETSFNQVVKVIRNIESIVEVTNTAAGDQ